MAQWCSLGLGVMTSCLDKGLQSYSAAIGGEGRRVGSS